VDDSINIFWKNDFSEYWESFIDFLQDSIKSWTTFSTLQTHRDLEFFFKIIFEVCKRTERNFEGKQRLTGEYKEYHSHLYEVARLYLEYSWENATLEWIIIALRHDDIEDLHKDSKSKIKVNFIDILQEDWYKPAIGVEMLTKPKVPHIDETRLHLGNQDLHSVREKQKIERDDKYYEAFLNIDTLTEELSNIADAKLWIKLKSDKKQLARDIAIVRIVDRIHNLRTMPEKEYSNEKRLRKLKNTEVYLLHLAQSLKMPRLYGDLVSSVIYWYTRYFKVKKNS